MSLIETIAATDLEVSNLIPLTFALNLGIDISDEIKWDSIDPETMQPVLQGLYTLQREIVQRHHPTTPLPDTSNAGSTTSLLYKDNLLARTFWYEVGAPPPEPIPPDYLLTLRAT